MDRDYAGDHRRPPRMHGVRYGGFPVSSMPGLYTGDCCRLASIVRTGNELARAGMLRRQIVLCLRDLRAVLQQGSISLLSG